MPKVKKPLRRSLRTTNTTNPIPTNLPSLRQRKPPKPPSLTHTLTQPPNDPNHHLPLFTLPPPLTLHLTTFLTLAEKIALALTCKAAAHIIGTKYWGLFKRKEHWARDPLHVDARAKLFELLMRDWDARGSGEEYCVGCGIIHPKLRDPGEYRETRWTRACLGQDAVVDYLPRGEEEGKGYVLVFPHILAALKESSETGKTRGEGPLIDMLSGAFTIECPGGKVSWSLESSGRRIDGRLVVRHVHTFRGLATGKKEKGKGQGNTITAQQILPLPLPLRLCPHQSTTTTLPPPSRYIKSRTPNAPLLTHAISSVFPAAERQPVDFALFRSPTKSEAEQISSASNNRDFVYRCRSCPTKFRTRYDDLEMALVVTSWHCLGRNAAQAVGCWRGLVRREGPLLGVEKRNDEWWSRGVGGVDFRVE
ncbi:hypothetical protein P280DRAFT_550232 [Massarina eburnea CBS 473.64]|uniref:F-box domain-containing protein n=1 Tax=Massarina eburnea CBS 473.64 TaxID=1395130 RepID=A0A6A6RZW5_9PLEO|nr:hypothetical protein P280DRAFT_550232 [Massarina eburnea CBS 473.64]